MTVIENQMMNMVCRAAKKIAETTLTARDLFAMAALSGMMTNASAPENGGTLPDSHDAKEYAESAYIVADAMLEARRKTKPE